MRSSALKGSDPCLQQHNNNNNKQHTCKGSRQPGQQLCISATVLLNLPVVSVLISAVVLVLRLKTAGF
jgi:hypothetical protein